MHIFADEGNNINITYTMDVTTGRRKNRKFPKWQRMPGDDGREESRMRRAMRTSNMLE